MKIDGMLIASLLVRLFCGIQDKMGETVMVQL